MWRICSYEPWPCQPTRSTSLQGPSDVSTRQDWWHPPSALPTRALHLYVHECHLRNHIHCLHGHVHWRDRMNPALKNDGTPVHRRAQWRHPGSEPLHASRWRQPSQNGSCGAGAGARRHTPKTDPRKWRTNLPSLSSIEMKGLTFSPLTLHFLSILLLIDTLFSRTHAVYLTHV